MCFPARLVSLWLQIASSIKLCFQNSLPLLSSSFNTGIAYYVGSWHLNLFNSLFKWLAFFLFNFIPSYPSARHPPPLFVYPLVLSYGSILSIFLCFSCSLISLPLVSISRLPLQINERSIPVHTKTTWLLCPCQRHLLYSIFIEPLNFACWTE